MVGIIRRIVLVVADATIILSSFCFFYKRCCIGYRRIMAGMSVSRIFVHCLISLTFGLIAQHGWPNKLSFEVEIVPLLGDSGACVCVCVLHGIVVFLMKWLSESLDVDGPPKNIKLMYASSNLPQNTHTHTHTKSLCFLNNNKQQATATTTQNKKQKKKNSDHLIFKTASDKQ